jgi:hypothetical protein
MLRDSIVDSRLSLISRRPELTNEILAKLSNHEGKKPSIPLKDEQIWTLLFTYGFVALPSEPDEGLAVLGQVITEGQCAWTPGRVAWLEMLPIPARKGKSGDSESNTELDLTAGDIGTRQNTKSGIEFKPIGNPTWICMVEAKWLSDIACHTEHDFRRNQLARIIETALAFQNQDSSPAFPSQVHVTLLTPDIFRCDGKGSGSRFYFYKFREYFDKGELIIKDINLSPVEKRNQPGEWEYPDLSARLSCLHLHWVTYEALFKAIPGSEFKDKLETFIDQYSGGVISA